MPLTDFEHNVVQIQKKKHIHTQQTTKHHNLTHFHTIAFSTTTRTHYMTHIHTLIHTCIYSFICTRVVSNIFSKRSFVLFLFCEKLKYIIFVEDLEDEVPEY